MDEKPLRDSHHRAGTRQPHDAVVIACVSQSYFGKPLTALRCPLTVGTSQYVTAEGYSIEAALWSWAHEETPAAMKEAAAQSFVRYLKLKEGVARAMFTSEP